MEQHEAVTEHGVVQQSALPLDPYYAQDPSLAHQPQYYSQGDYTSHLAASNPYTVQYAPETSYASGAQYNYPKTPSKQASFPKVQEHTASVHAGSPHSQLHAQISPSIHQHHFHSPYAEPLQDLPYVRRTDLENIQESLSPTFHTHGLTSGTAHIASTAPFHFTYGSPTQQYQTPYIASASSSPSLSGSRRQSISENTAFTAYPYTSPPSSAVPSGLAGMKTETSFGSLISGSKPSSSSLSRRDSLPQSGPPSTLSVSAQGIITVYTAHPLFGVAGTAVNVTIGIVPHEPHTIRGFRVMYGQHGTTTRVIGERRVPDGERVDLSAATPPVHLTGRYPGTSVAVPLVLQALDEAGNVVDWVQFGTFSYAETPTHNRTQSQKRPGSPLAGTRESPITPSRAFFPDTPSGHKKAHSRHSSVGSLVNGFGSLGYHSRSSSMASLAEQEAQLVIAPDGELLERKPIARLRAPTTTPSSTPSSSALRHPPTAPLPNSVSVPLLYRTSQIPGAIETGGSAKVTLDKASLCFEGNLDLMALGWSHEEWMIKRRLVQFSRRQEGQKIIARFRPTSLHELTEDDIVISCIFREDKNECFVTSVDAIYLLEALVAVRFTVEEKNRIRRNLEGFKPITISKGKADGEPFFKLIMGFPHPKPRNIEKDVKVFPWKTLGTALQKIVSKYSATFVTPEDLAAPGRPPPQPIGWAPGQEPAPAAAQNSVEGVETAQEESSTPQQQQQHPGATSLATVPEDA